MFFAVVASDDSPLNSELKCCPLVISVQQEMIAALDRWLFYLRNHLKLAELAAKYIHRCGKAFILDLPPTSRASRWFFGVSQGSAAYPEMARLGFWPESHNGARIDARHRKTCYSSVLLMKVTAVVPAVLSALLKFKPNSYVG